MTRPSPVEYFEWLYRHIGDPHVRDPHKSYFCLATQLHNKEFRFFVPNDDNRAFDGVMLRDEFCEDLDFLDEMLGPCTMLEMLIGLSKRLDFLSSTWAMDGVRFWFWQLLHNVGLAGCTDDYCSYPGSLEHIDNTLEMIIARTYNSNGRGGLFPLRHPRGDQRKTELWYQMSQYLIEFDVADE